MPIANCCADASLPSLLHCEIECIFKLFSVSSCRMQSCAINWDLGVSAVCVCVRARARNTKPCAHWCNGEFASRLSRVKMRAILTKCKSRDAEAAITHTHTYTHAITFSESKNAFKFFFFFFFFCVGFVLCVSQKKQKYILFRHFCNLHMHYCFSGGGDDDAKRERRMNAFCIESEKKKLWKKKRILIIIIIKRISHWYVMKPV